MKTVPQEGIRNNPDRFVSHTHGTLNPGHPFPLENGELKVNVAGAAYTVVGGELKAGESAGTAQTVAFEYDASGLRVRKIGGDATTNYTLHGKLITHLQQGASEMHFFYGAQSRPALAEFNGAVYTYAHNLQGGIVYILDASNTRVVEYKYDAWGKPIGQPWTLTTAYDALAHLNPFRYRGYVYDEETGLYSLRSRHYDPAWGQFVNADSRIGKIGKLLDHNMFNYCNNNSIMLVDPNGKDGIVDKFLRTFSPIYRFIVDKEARDSALKFFSPAYNIA